MKSFKITALSLVLVLLLAACGAKNDTPDEPAVDPTPEPPIEQPVEKTPDERINDIIAGMSIEEKVGQLFFVRCPETGAAEDVSAYHLGGLLLFGRDYKDANGDWLTEDDFTAALASYQDAAAIPLFIGSDEEGGTVTRASRDPNLFSALLPSPQELYAAGAPFVLVSHNIVECMDGAYPASLSAKVHTLLRDTLGFTGVIVTDDLAMDAVKAYAQDGSAAVLAIQAGNDMIVTTDYQTQIPQVIAAVQSGEIAESDIDAHVFRVLHEKQALGLID